MPSTSAIESLAKTLRTRSATLSLAESCTGGLVSARIAALSGVSDVYRGGVVAYSNDLKLQILKVPPAVLRQLGAVSNTVAIWMARGAREQLRSDWAASITGIAGPSGGTPLKPVGTVCFAVVGPGVEWAASRHFKGDRSAIQDQSATFIVDALRVAIAEGVEGLVAKFDA